jgi:hypothetical protein
MIATLFGVLVCALLFAGFAAFVRPKAGGCTGSGKCETCKGAGNCVK